MQKAWFDTSDARQVGSTPSKTSVPALQARWASVGGLTHQRPEPASSPEAVALRLRLCRCPCWMTNVRSATHSRITPACKAAEMTLGHGDMGDIGKTVSARWGTSNGLLCCAQCTDL